MHKIIRCGSVAVLVIILASLFWHGLSATTAAPITSEPVLYHKSRLGLMPPAYGAPAYGALAYGPFAPSLTANSGQFAPFVIYPSGAWPEAVVAGDLTGDGRLDAALSTAFDWDAENDDRLHLFAQTGGGALTRVQRLTTGSQPAAMAAGDLNHNGLLDLVVANQDDNTLALFVQDGAGLTATLVLSTGGGPDAVAVGDFNCNLRADIAVVHAISQTVGLYHQQADGSFAPPVWLGLSSAGYNDIAVGDLNGNGYDDLVVLRGAGHTTDHVAIFYQQNCALSAPVFRTVEDGGFLAHGLAVGDITGDGRDDIVVTAGGNAPTAYLNVFAQQPDGTLPLTPTVYAAHHLPEAVEIGDVNHDGRNDVVVVHAAWMTFSVYTQTLTGTLSAFETYALPHTDHYRPGGLALADVTGDGGLDALIANRSSLPAANGLVVLANTAPAPTSTFTTPALPQFITHTDTLTFPIAGMASHTADTLELSFDGGRTWITQTASPAWSYPWDSPAADGSYTLLVRAIDAAGRVQSPPARSRLVVDRTPPVGEIIINDGDTHTNSPTVTLTLIATDASQVTHMRFSHDAVTWVGWEDYAPTRQWTLQPGDGLKTVYVQFRDIVGHVSASASAAILLDTTSSPPTGSISINDGADYTHIPTVTLTLAASGDLSVARMRFSHDGAAWSDWEAYATTRQWPLSPGDGLKTVYAQFRDVARNVSDPVSDTITLDTTPLEGSLNINDGAHYTRFPTVTLTLTATDAAQMRFSHDAVTWADWITYTLTHTWFLTGADGLKSVYAQFQDDTQRTSDPILATITLDTVPPTGTLTINEGVSITTQSPVTLTLTATDAHTVTHMRFSHDAVTWVGWEDYAPTRQWTLTPGDGLKTVFVQFQDTPGNVSAPLSATITLSGSHEPLDDFLVINDGAQYTRIPTVTLTLTATDAARMRFSHNAVTWEGWITYTLTHTWVLTGADGLKSVYAQLQDDAQSVSDPLSATITLDTIPPTGTLTINDGAATTAELTVTLTLSATDQGSGICDMQLRNASDDWQDWQPYTTTLTWELATGGGVRTVEARFQDCADNESPVVAAEIEVTSSSPPNRIYLPLVLRNSP